MPNWSSRCRVNGPALLWYIEQCLERAEYLSRPLIVPALSFDGGLGSYCGVKLRHGCDIGGFTDLTDQLPTHRTAEKITFGQREIDLR